MGVYYYFSNETTSEMSKRSFYAKFHYLDTASMIVEFQNHINENNWSDSDIIVASPDTDGYAIKYTNGHLMVLKMTETWSMGCHYYFSNETTSETSKGDFEPNIQCLDEETKIAIFQNHINKNNWNDSDIIVASPDNDGSVIKYTNGHLMSIKMTETWS